MKQDGAVRISDKYEACVFSYLSHSEYACCVVALQLRGIKAKTETRL